MKQIFLLAFILLLTGSNGSAGQSIVVVRGQDFPPYHYADTDGNEQGFVLETVRSVAGILDLTVRFEQYPWSRCLEMVRRGHADAMMNLFNTEARQAYLFFSNNILAYEVNQFFRLKNRPVSYSGNLSDLRELKIGVIRNYSYGPRFDAVDFPFLLMHETEADLISSLINRRCDIILGNAVVLRQLEKQMTVENVIHRIDPPVSIEPLYLGFSKARGHRQLSDRFSKALDAFKKTPAYTAILKKYHIQFYRQEHGDLWQGIGPDHPDSPEPSIGSAQ